MKKLFEVYFTLAEPASIVVAAEDEDEAEEIFDQISKEEIVERFLRALEMGVEIDVIEDLEEEEE